MDKTAIAVLITIFVYLAVMVVIGILYSKKNKSADDFGFTKILDEIQLQYLLRLSILITIIVPIFVLSIFILIRKIFKEK